MSYMLAAMLLSQGINIVGALNNKKTAELNGELQKTAAELNAETQRTSIMEQYTDLFSKQASDIATQTAVFANSGIDKASSIFRQGLAKHERNFLDSKADMESDMKNLDINLANTKANIDIDTKNKKREAYSKVVSGLMNTASMYMGYKANKLGDVTNINGGRTVGMNAGQSNSIIGSQIINKSLQLDIFGNTPKYKGGWYK